MEESEEEGSASDLTRVTQTLAAADIGPGQDNFEESGFVENGDASPSRGKDSEVEEINKTTDVEAEGTVKGASDD